MCHFVATNLYNTLGRGAAPSAVRQPSPPSPGGRGAGASLAPHANRVCLLSDYQGLLARKLAVFHLDNLSAKNSKRDMDVQNTILISRFSSVTRTLQADKLSHSLLLF